MARASKPKKKKAESISQPVAAARKQSIAPAPENTPPGEELPTLTVPSDDKKGEPSPAVEVKRSNTTSAHVTTSAPPSEEPAPVVVPVEKKPRPKKRPRPAVQPEVASIPAPVPMSLSVAQSMAISAPLPEYPYEAKRRNLTGSGVCVITVDPATGRVTNATMSESTGSAMLDKLTIQAFKSWRFKPGTVSQVRLPISYE